MTGSTFVKYGEHEIDFAKFQRLSMREAVCRYWPAGAAPAPTIAELAAPGGPRAAAERYNAWAHIGGPGATDGPREHEGRRNYRACCLKPWPSIT